MWHDAYMSVYVYVVYVMWCLYLVWCDGFCACMHICVYKEHGSFSNMCTLG